MPHVNEFATAARAAKIARLVEQIRADAAAAGSDDLTAHVPSCGLAWDELAARAGVERAGVDTRSAVRSAVDAVMRDRLTAPDPFEGL